MAHTMPHNWDDEHHFHKPDPVFPVWYQMLKFFTSWKMLIDLATLLPFFILLDQNPVFFPNSSGGGNFNFIRVFRLLRILHIFKITKKNQVLSLVERTMELSMPTMVLTGYITCIHMVFWGSLVHFFEQGEWRSSAGLDGFEAYPDGTYMRKNYMSGEWEPSPFNSIAIGIYWTIMMTSTTGVGEGLQPTTDGGRACAALVVCIGVILMAIPLGVVGLNFSQEWEKMKIKHLTTESAPLQRITMSTDKVAVIHIGGDAGDTEVGMEVQKAQSESEKNLEHIHDLNVKMMDNVNKIAESHRHIQLVQESLHDLMMKMNARVEAFEKEKATTKKEADDGDL